MKRGPLILICLILIAASVWLRLSKLDRFLTPDENLWATRVTQFVMALDTRDWASTNVTGHPGVITMWAGSLGVMAKWLFARSSDAHNFLDSVSALAANPVRLDYLPWLRAPIVLFCTGALVSLYLLARQLTNERVALLAGGLMTFNPFLLAHGRLLQMDGLLAMTVAMAWLALVAALSTGQRRLYLVSGISIGAAVLTKSPALVMGPLMLGAILATHLRSAGLTRAGRRRILHDLLWVGVPTLVVVFALWPALWVKPLDTLGGVWRLMTAYGGGEHELGNYWLGRPAPEPGRLFYLLIVALRTTPVTLIGLLLALAGSVLRPNLARRERWPIWAFWAFVLWFGLILSFGAKKFDRYLLPIFPVLDILAAWGWLNALGWIAGRLQARRNVYVSTTALAAVWAGAILLVGAQAWSAFSTWPSYLTAYNPLLGGIQAAADNVLVGWGEGLAEAAAYLNDRPDAEHGHTAAWYGKNVFGAFYRGESLDLHYDVSSATDLYAHDVDWVVTYINQEQRGLLDATVRARLAAPLYRVMHDGVTLAAVFAWPKPFAHTTDRVIAEGVNLLGWQVEAYDRAAGALPATFYWNAPALANVAQQRILVWLKDTSGEVWAVAEDTIGAERLADPEQRAAGWLDQSVIAQSVVLHPPVGLHPGVYRIELALFAGAPIELTRLQISPTRLAEVISLGPGVHTPGEDIRFGDIARLVGAEVVVANESWTVDLLWEWLEPSNEPYHYFIHVVNAVEQMIAQQDGPLAERGGSGELTRQRIHLQLPGSAAETAARAYVGIYRPQDGVRAPLTAGGRVLPDGRYLLATRP